MPAPFRSLVWLLLLGVIATAAAASSVLRSTAAAAAAKDAVVNLHLRLGGVSHDLGPDGDHGSYVCVCMDWWPGNKCGDGLCPWTNASILTADLDPIRLRNLLRQLGDGVTLRMGGTLADSIINQEDEEENSEKDQHCLPFEPAEPEASSNFEHGCLKRERWRSLVQFAQNTSAKIVFGLNAMYGRENSTSNPWSSTNARSFLEFMRDEKLDLPVIGFEFGNELDKFDITAQEHAEGFHRLRLLLIDVFGLDRADEFRLIGPDPASWKTEFMANFLPLVQDILWGISWHTYPLGPGYDEDDNNNSHLDDRIMRANFSDGMGTKAAQQIAEYPQLRLVMGESGGAYRSGNAEANNRFMDAFFYLKAMGRLAQHNHSMFCRQALLGGNYALVDADTLEPNPSYYAAVLFRRLMGRRVLNTQVSLDSTTNETLVPYRVFAHCNQEQSRLGMLLLNYSPDMTVDSILVQDDRFSSYLPWDLVPREEYIVTADSLKSKTIIINGKKIQTTTDSDEGYFDLNPKHVTRPHPSLSIPPRSYAFFVFEATSRISQNVCVGA